MLTDPDIGEPVQIAFDGDGRMYVVEMRSYMLDADATNEFTAISRISRHEDRDGDGVYEIHTVFVDSLVAPRFVTPFGKDAVLTKETNADDVWRYTDTDGDGRADRKELFTTNFGRSANLEHQEGSLFWALDNWMYSTVNAFRVRWTPNGVVREPTGFNGAQWGATQDDDGKTWFQGGASGLPSSFQFPIVYGNIEVPDQYEPGFDVPWGAPVKLADMQGGMGAVRMPDGSLNRVTAGSGADVYRGHRLPADLRGDYLYGEVVGRIVRRVRPVVRDGLTQLRNVYQPEKAEFIRSTDPLFRPVEVKTAPDGSVYVVDMYHGIVQEAQWVPKGSYLRAKVEQYQLDKITGRGRIWRLTHDGHAARPRAAAHAARVAGAAGAPSPAPERLVARHGAAAARARAGPLGGAGADGDGSSRHDAGRSLSRAVDARGTRRARRRAGARADEGPEPAHAHPGDPRERVALEGGGPLVRGRLSRPDAGSGRERRDPGDADGERAQGARRADDHPRSAGGEAGAGGAGGGRAAAQATHGAGSRAGQRLVLARGARVAGEGRHDLPRAVLAVSRRRRDGHSRGRRSGDRARARGLAARAGPRRVRDPNAAARAHRPDRRQELCGRDHGADARERRRLDRGGRDVRAERVRQHGVARVATGSGARARRHREPTTAWTYDELVASVPRVLAPSPAWKVTASHAPATAARAPYVPGWSSDSGQRAGMWLQVELPAPARLTEIRFDSPPRFPRGYFGLPIDKRPPVPQTYARGYRAEVSMDGLAWSPVAQGTGAPSTVIMFTPTLAKLVRITLTTDAENALPWNVQTLRLWELPPSGTR